MFLLKFKTKQNKMQSDNQKLELFEFNNHPGG